MSKAGIQSNRGDGYQTLVAFECALTVLSDPDYQWLEIDSVKWLVDDVVVGKKDGTIICCQCKKNQPDFKSWSISELADELRKAAKLLEADTKTIVRFYSRSSFGELAALCEFSVNYGDEFSYKSNLGKLHGETDRKLKLLIEEISPTLSTYEFLCRTEFSVSSTLGQMQTLLKERLSRLATNTSTAYDTIWVKLDHLGMRLPSHSQSAAIQHRLTKDDLQSMLNQVGVMLAPPLNLLELRSSFQSISSIGRAWRRDIGKQHLPSPLVDALILAIVQKPGSILLTGAPGSGKTCVMLDLQEALELRAKNRNDLVPLFIQSREFADTVTMEERKSQGLSERWVEEVSRVAESVHVVVVIDSLDVLSIAREHTILTYFLAQIDRLLSIPNVTVITACREFDRYYDFRIARRTWDKEFTCAPLDWESTIVPLLKTLEIDTAILDNQTRELIRNPRELALFVELAERGDSFTAVTSQALATRYLSKVIQEDNVLGDVAMQAIETIATEMMKSRSLAIPIQRFNGPQEMLRVLLSHDILHKTNDQKLTFGHQTLLDILVVNGAIRRGSTLNEFIRGLAPVPFVRPSIRSFIAQLATEDRRYLRKQLRTVLFGDYAFHIRRLIAETIAEQPPENDDWRLIDDLRKQRPEIFQVIYINGIDIRWHHFWLKHLVPEIKNERDTNILTKHVNRIAQWKNDDPTGVLNFWTEALSLTWANKEQISSQLEILISDIDKDYATAFAPLLVNLLKFRHHEHRYLGRAIAVCVEQGAINDAVLWEYIAGEVTDDEASSYLFGKRLRCQSHHFDRNNKDFLSNRMRSSTTLLDLAIDSIERWSQIKQRKYGEDTTNYRSGFLSDTSYDDSHSITDVRHIENERVLMDVIEAAITQHARINSSWWKNNCNRLCLNSEGALRYFGIIAVTNTPKENLYIIGKILTSQDFLESDLSYELGTLINAAYVYIDSVVQDKIQENILQIHCSLTSEEQFQSWILKQKAQFIVNIPSYLRHPASIKVIDECERNMWPFKRAPDINHQGGMIGSPFSFEIFFDLSNRAILRLLSHYNGYNRYSFDEFMLGGEREVGAQLSQAASRKPVRFLNFLQVEWANISNSYCDDIMDGISNYLSYRYGNLRADGNWVALEDPDPTALAKQVLDELERHPSHWKSNRSASKAIQSCAHVISNSEDAERLTFLAFNFVNLRENSSVWGDKIDLITIGINMTKGHIVEAAMVLAVELEENQAQWPELLTPLIRRLAADEHPAVRALVLRRLPYIQSKHPKFGWELFDIAVQKDTEDLLVIAEPCFYYSYHSQFAIVSPWLNYLYDNSTEKGLKVWGRICALAALSNRINFDKFLSQLILLENAQAWRGAASVWTYPDNYIQHREQCVAGLELGLNERNSHAPIVAQKFQNLFRATALISIPENLIKLFFALLEKEENSSKSDIFGLNAWLNTLASRDPVASLTASEIYLDFIGKKNPYLHDYENNFPQLLTSLFSYAEEQEEIDGGHTLRRVVNIQDTLLVLGINEINDWLKAAERA